MNRTGSFFAVFLIFLFAGKGLMAQEFITPLAGNPSAAAYYKENRKIKKSAAAVLLELPFFEDFSTSSVEPDPSLWSDADAYINNNYCIKPPTNGVATFDAIDYQGSIYASATFDPVSFVADHLTSHPINLDYSSGDSLYLSFLYQAKGLGEVPDEVIDVMLELKSDMKDLDIQLHELGDALPDHLKEHADRYIRSPRAQRRDGASHHTERHGYNLW